MYMVLKTGPRKLRLDPNALRHCQVVRSLLETPSICLINGLPLRIAAASARS